jgi:hypothetical protein
MIRLYAVMLLVVLTKCVDTGCIYEPEERKLMPKVTQDYYRILDSLSGKLNHSKLGFLLEAYSRVVKSKMIFQKKECDQLLGWLNTCSWKHKFLVGSFTLGSLVTFGINILTFVVFK